MRLGGIDANPYHEDKRRRGIPPKNPLIYRRVRDLKAAIAAFHKRCERGGTIVAGELSALDNQIVTVIRGAETRGRKKGQRDRKPRKRPPPHHSEVEILLLWAIAYRQRYGEGARLFDDRGRADCQTRGSGTANREPAVMLRLFKTVKADRLKRRSLQRSAGRPDTIARLAAPLRPARAAWNVTLDALGPEREKVLRLVGPPRRRSRAGELYRGDDLDRAGCSRPELAHHPAPAPSCARPDS